ncbi:aldo/keto reductase [Streptomyces sp. SID3343]|uniref:aldo/keto reductase n=1 Tax=Streptomyces sp. SID3343 TaxID=2690260 RepID=UPI00136F7862|nr:hypothetical protein [Streptomyces sp. SID3343]
MTATLALGTYRCRDVALAATVAVAAGVEWIDTAPNYGAGTAERALAPILAAHPRIRVSTKVGFMTREAATEALTAGILHRREAGIRHSLAPKFVRWQIHRSRSELGRRPDVVFLHNPEHASERSREARTARLLSAIGVLEEAAADGTIGGYGVATWTGFSTGRFDVGTLLSMTRTVAGERHHLRAVQLPISLVHLEPVVAAMAGGGVLRDALAAGIEVFASAPLHGGELPAMLTPEAVELVGDGLTAAQAALIVPASAPGVCRVLLSSSDPQHWSDAMSACARPPLDPSRLRRISDVFAA